MFDPKFLDLKSFYNPKFFGPEIETFCGPKIVLDPVFFYPNFFNPYFFKAKVGLTQENGNEIYRPIVNTMHRLS